MGGNGFRRANGTGIRQDYDGDVGRRDHLEVCAGAEHEGPGVAHRRSTIGSDPDIEAIAIEARAGIERTRRRTEGRNIAISAS
jgi:hypothetical protein